MPHVRDPLSLDTEADAGFFSPVRSSWRTSVVTCLCGLCRCGPAPRDAPVAPPRAHLSIPRKPIVLRRPEADRRASSLTEARRVDGKFARYVPESFYDRAERVRGPDRRIRGNDHAASALPLPFSKAPSVVAERRPHAPVHRPKAHGLNETQS
jgi:hypothetical protein